MTRQNRAMLRSGAAAETVMRLAWFTPVPPARSGIAAYSAELLPELARRHEIDVFVDEREQPRQAGAVGPVAPRDAFGALVHGAHDFLWKHLRRPYDLVVYQLGNASCHDYMWPYLTRYPGLLVLHDGQLHHARARQLLRAGRDDDYRAEFRFSHPDARPEIAELVISGHGGPMLYFWPMTALAVKSARMVAVHNDALACQLEQQFPGTPVERIRMGVTDPLAGRSPLESSRARDLLCARHGIPRHAFLFAAFGGVTPEKRLEPVIRAMAAMHGTMARFHLLIVGQKAPNLDVEGVAAALGIAERVSIAGYVGEEDLPLYLAAADACLCLRWPTSRETSASWLRCVAAGKATVITELAHLADVPSLNPRTWATSCAPPMDRGSGAGEMTGQQDELTGQQEAVCIGIDLLDEEHWIGVALGRLMSDPGLRARLEHRARLYWAGRHTLRAMTDDYERVLARAVELPLPPLGRLPQHLRADGTARARELTQELGVSVDFLSESEARDPRRMEST
jgi:glycosyltransferase involved in cell wall biosynthesis